MKRSGPIPVASLLALAPLLFVFGCATEQHYAEAELRARPLVTQPVVSPQPGSVQCSITITAAQRAEFARFFSDGQTPADMQAGRLANATACTNAAGDVTYALVSRPPVGSGRVRHDPPGIGRSLIDTSPAPRVELR